MALQCIDSVILVAYLLVVVLICDHNPRYMYSHVIYQPLETSKQDPGKILEHRIQCYRLRPIYLGTSTRYT